MPQSAVPLLAVLVFAPQSGVHRTRIGEMLWPDTEVGKQNRRLNTTIWRLRDAMRRGTAADAIDTSPCGVVSLRTDVETDVAPLLHVSRQAPTEVEAVADDVLESAARIVAEDLFAGCFHDVVIRGRERLGAARLRAMVALLERHVAGGRLDSGIWWARRILEVDPYREDVHRQLIGVLRQAGRPRDALDQLDRCCRILREELGVEPAASTFAAAGLDDDGGRADLDPPVRDLLLNSERLCSDALAGLRQAIAELRPS